jgi:predicted O-methyltransferase YrrM
VKLERLEDTSRLVPDDSTKLPEMLSRFATVPGMVPLREGLFLYSLAYAAGSRGDIVEIGSWQGRSTAFLAQACDDTDNGVVHAIDTFRGNPGKEGLYAVSSGDIEAGFRANIERMGLAHRVVVHPKTAALARSEVKGPLRMLFIDGEHTHEAVKSDLAYADLLAPGGLVVFDDYAPAFPGVVGAAQEFLSQGGFSRPFQRSGILVARRLR